MSISTQERCKILHRADFLILPSEYLKALTLAETALISYLVTKQRMIKEAIAFDEDDPMIQEEDKQEGVTINCQVLKEETGIKEIEATQITSHLRKLGIIEVCNEEDKRYIINYEELDSYVFNNIR